MTTNPRRPAGDERGAVLVHVAVAMLALIGFSALAIDYGAFWVSRRQAQNAADAAALAGALSLAFDDPDDTRGPRPQRRPPAAANLVWARRPRLWAATDVTSSRARRARRVCPIPASVPTSIAARNG